MKVSLHTLQHIKTRSILPDQTPPSYSASLPLTDTSRVLLHKASLPRNYTPLPQSQHPSHTMFSGQTVATRPSEPKFTVRLSFYMLSMSSISLTVYLDIQAGFST